MVQHPMGLFLRTDIEKSGKQDRADQIEIAHDDGAVAHIGADAAKLPPVQQLTVRQMDVGE